ncbi:MarR family winged helix-turn-helix transcriptional regulator [Leucobacter sp. HNU]|uniref:MarR family winged helix-turn-helix transcriptional regulator n=1 Tax=Leucobacter sp. HNU TaxID=3236805 RepID=UPI003A7FED3A
MPQNIIRHEQEHLYAEPPKSEAGRELASALLRLRRAEHVQELRALTSSSLSNLDLRALRYLVQAQRDERSIGAKDLIVMLGTSSANITNVIDRLVGRGYVERMKHPSDRRASILVPTPAAVQQVELAIGSHHARLVEQIDELDDRDAEIAASVVARIAASLDELAEEQRRISS